jgi:hypothetical protein
VWESTRNPGELQSRPKNPGLIRKNSVGTEPLGFITAGIFQVAPACLGTKKRCTTQKLSEGSGICRRFGRVAETMFSHRLAKRFNVNVLMSRRVAGAVILPFEIMRLPNRKQLGGQDDLNGARIFLIDIVFNGLKKVMQHNSAASRPMNRGKSNQKDGKKRIIFPSPLGS